MLSEIVLKTSKNGDFKKSLNVEERIKITECLWHVLNSIFSFIYHQIILFKTFVLFCILPYLFLFVYKLLGPIYLQYML